MLQKQKTQTHNLDIQVFSVTLSTTPPGTLLGSELRGCMVLALASVMNTLSDFKLMAPTGTYEPITYIPAVKASKSEAAKDAQGFPLGIRALVKAVYASPSRRTAPPSLINHLAYFFAALSPCRRRAKSTFNSLKKKTVSL